jgi:hypothetical protein
VSYTPTPRLHHNRAPAVPAPAPVLGPPALGDTKVVDEFTLYFGQRWDQVLPQWHHTLPDRIEAHGLSTRMHAAWMKANGLK